MAFNRVSKLMARSERATPVGEGSADLLQTCALRFFFFWASDRSCLLQTRRDSSVSALNSL